MIRRHGHHHAEDQRHRRRGRSLYSLQFLLFFLIPFRLMFFKNSGNYFVSSLICDFFPSDFFSSFYEKSLQIRDFESSFSNKYFFCLHFATIQNFIYLLLREILRLVPDNSLGKMSKFLSFLMYPELQENSFL